jgi:hypothetical protein
MEVGLDEARTVLDVAEGRRALEAAKGSTDGPVEDALARWLQGTNLTGVLRRKPQNSRATVGDHHPHTGWDAQKDSRVLRMYRYPHDRSIISTR